MHSLPQSRWPTRLHPLLRWAELEHRIIVWCLDRHRVRAGRSAFVYFCPQVADRQLCGSRQTYVNPGQRVSKRGRAGVDHRNHRAIL